MKAKTPLESEVLREICEWLNASGNYLFWRSNNIPVFGTNNAGKRTFRAMPKYAMKGLPDIMLISKGFFIGIEVKREGKTLRPEQKEFRDKVMAKGGIYLEVHSLYELESKIKAMDL